MALVISSAAAAALLDIGLVTGPIIGFVLYESKGYLEKGKLIDVIPHSDIKSRALVESTGLGDLNGVDGLDWNQHCCAFDDSRWRSYC